MNLDVILGHMEVCSDDGEWERMVAQEKARKHDLRERRAGIPARYRGADLYQCSEEIRDYCKSVKHGSGDWLLLTGTNGSGKTYAACAIAREILKTDKVRFVSMQEILDEVKSSYSNSTTQEDVMRSYTTPRLVIIDDFGKENPTEWALPIMYELFNARYERNLPTIVTTNNNAKELIEHMAKCDTSHYATSIVSRLCQGTVLTMNGRDRRLDVRTRDE